ncbi:MAG: FAD-dependent oxidoreductase [Deltaproteobacteria bacterium]|nr:FAD-dependent oxidoreductase [Deltaproteobacteria bacterium]
MVEPIVVIGAGPAGISAAWQLAKRGIPVEVIEQDSVVGGLAKTISHRAGLRYDYGPHTFHIRETESSRRVVSEVQSLLNGQYRVLDRGTRLFLKGNYFVYPPEMSEVVRKVSPRLGLRIGWDYMYAALRYAINPAKQEDSFEDWGVRNLGRTLYDTFFGLYSEKVWGISMSQVSSRQAQRVAKLNLKNIMLRMFRFKADPDTYFIQYFYPCDGIGTLYQRMAEEVRASGGMVHLNATATRIVTAGQKVRAVAFEQAGKERVIPCHGLVSTLPLSVVTPMFAPVLSPTTLEMADKLDYCSLILSYLVINRPRVTDYHWCYLIDPEFKCNRFSEQKNVSPDLLPRDKTVLCVETSCRYEDDRWRTTDNDLGQMAVTDLLQMGILRSGNVEEHFVTRIRNAYPIYRLGFERVLYALLSELHQVRNFYTIGRHGLFMNNSMDDNVEMGMRVAEHIAEREAREAWWQSVLRWTQLEGVEAL